ncbi:VOC family protein [Haloechinothrix sp. YIM 98757]|uniref:VOC family protein n=1 Tax=Haloechinothrix aidingensis TaxID=2752311 RepID=A0A838A8M7_9PSEU|nr:VOC family protein [Haloechinothrix aidingensis]MBA0124871.1 VOC family protein [Haloechinothrix aidingensis]
MPTKAFVNLPVKDLTKSVAFFTELGFEFDPKFTDDNATCMIVNDGVAVMLLVEEFFGNFTSKKPCDTGTHAEAIIALSAGSRDEVDSLVDRALSAGGSPSNEPMDMEGMYGRSFQDVDGHNWEVMYMDPSVMGQ